MKTIDELKEHFEGIEFPQKYMEILNYIRENDNAKVSIQGQAGSGKALPLDTIIPTPNGNVRFGDLKVGDYVFDRHGNPTKVVGVFPQGELDLYKLVLSDGRETYCNDEHLWTCYTSKGNFKTLTLKEIMNQGLLQESKSKNDKRIRYSTKFKIPTNGCVEFNNSQKLPINPYVIGAFIGNGCNLQKQLTISSNDEFTVKMCADLLGFDYKKNSDKNYNWTFYFKDNDCRKTKNRLNPHTNEVFSDFINELCVHSHEKRIPSVYKYASKEDRIALIQGLFDTDGSIGTGTRANVTYSSTSLGLIKDIQEVLYSLGYSSSIVEDNRDNHNRPCYELIALVDNCEKYNFFRLPRKLERIPNTKKQRRYDRIGIREVIPMNKKVEMMCIKVDNNEELFLTNDYIVTHNTTLLKIINYMFSDDVKNGNFNVAIASSTGVASALLNNNSNIGATTVHSLFKLKPLDIFGSFNPSSFSKKELIANIDCLIIDEVSMISCDLFDHIMEIVRYCRHGKPTRVILFGDCLQLQCVVKKDNVDVKNYYQLNYNGNVEFFSSYAFRDMKFATFLLTKIYRQNADEEGEKFKDILNRIRVCEQSQDDLDWLNQRVISEEDYIMQHESFLRIVSTNRDVQKYNQIALDSIDGNFICLEAKISGNFRETSEFKSGFFAEKIWVKVGCPVMITRNAKTNEDGTRDYYNGSMGTLVSCCDDYAEVDLGDRIIKVEPSVTNNYEYELVEEDGKTVVKSRITGSYENIMIKVCSASTIHKTQGLTLNFGYIDFNRWIPDSGVYVALSRFRSIKNFGLRKPIKMSDIHATQESLNYVKNNEYQENLYNDLFGEDSDEEKVDERVNLYTEKVSKLAKFFEENKFEIRDGKIFDAELNMEIKL